MNKYLFTINLGGGTVLQQIITAANTYQAEEILKSEFKPMYGDIEYILVDIEEHK